ncbi:MAG: ATP-binding cassette domain-containing protein, partial [Clostridia bacterium]|nr:ATP-binding cassette domain-containing protein [Clostridia bacterium]
NCVRLMNFPEDEGIAVELPEKCSISLHNVTFRYPNQEKNALDGVSFDVAPGETVAIVGENGSGKSTLMRLLTGMYKPDEGEVMYGRYSTKEINMSSVARNYSAVFQNYAHYAISLRENLIVGDTDAVPEEGKMTLACRRGGFEPTEEWLPSGLDTILDEPTAAIDPIEEARIYNRFATLAKDKTAFIVTHRLGSVRLADRLIVTKDGRAAETGTHERLKAKNGEYRRMFESQSSWYKEA